TMPHRQANNKKPGSDHHGLTPVSSGDLFGFNVPTLGQGLAYKPHRNGVLHFLTILSKPDLGYPKPLLGKDNIALCTRNFYHF
ncbi:hypothetical protein, partial [Flavonifractor sp. An306]|uniref:hypothetical protein n=1 Tax=Flavonifractor sp. An306 TaxID=1965629 RepID=UPI00194DDC11